MRVIKECPNYKFLFPFLLCLLVAGLTFTACLNSEKAKQQHLERGENHLKTRHYQEAALEFRSALEMDTNSPDAYWGIARATEGQGRIYETVDALKKVVELNPKNLDARAKLGNYYLLFSPPQFGETERLLGEIFKIDPNFIEGHILKASLLAAQNKPDKDVLAVLENAIKLDANRIETYLSLARFYTNKQDSKNAEATYQRALKINDNSAVANSEYGRFLQYANRPEEAEARLRRAVEIEADNRDWLENLAKFYLTRNQPDKAEQTYRLLADLDKNLPEGQAVLADFYSNTGREDEAVKIYQEILTKTPEFARARYRLGEIFLQRNDLEAVKVQLKELLSRNDKDSSALLLQSRLNLREGKPDEAVKHLEQILKLEPTAQLPLYYMADAKLRSGQIEQSRTYLSDLERYHPEFLFGKLLSIQTNFASDEPAKALKQADELLTKLNQSAPDRQVSAQTFNEIKANVYNARGLANIRLGKPAEARNDFQSAQKVAPNSTNAYLNLARVALATKNPAEAIVNYEKVLSFKPDDFDALSGVVTVYSAQKNFEAAHQKVESQIAANANNKKSLAALHYLNSQIFSAENNLAQSEAELNKAIETDGDYLPAYTAYAALLLGKDEKDKAIEKYQEILKRRPDDAGIYTLIGIIQDGNGNVTEAVNNYKKALEINPQMAIAANNLAWLYAAHGTGSLDEADQLAHSAVGKYPQEPSFADTLGFVLTKKGLASGAVEQFKKAVSLDAASASQNGRAPNAAYRARLGAALAAKGDKDAAKRELEIALQDEKSLSSSEAQEAHVLLGTL